MPVGAFVSQNDLVKLLGIPVAPLRDALRVLRQRRREDALKLKALRLQIKAGREALDRGDFTEVDEAQLDVFFEELISPAGKSSR